MGVPAEAGKPSTHHSVRFLVLLQQRPVLGNSLGLNLACSCVVSLLQLPVWGSTACAVVQTQDPVTPSSGVL
jgi:hypothetical protein